MIIRAAVLRKTHEPFQIELVNLQPPQFGEVLIQMKSAGICHSDWHIVSGATPHPMPVVPGHEGSGVVEAVGDGVVALQIGDHVSLSWAPSCGKCFYCEQGQQSLCAEYLKPIWAGTMMDGTTRLSQKGEPIYHFSSLACFAEKAVVPQECCVKLDTTVPFEIGALIGCAVTTGVGAVLQTAKVRAESSVVVFGAGGVGLSIILGAKYAGAKTIIAVDRTEQKLEIAKGIGATHGLIHSANTVAEIRNLTGGRGADYAFEAAGIPALQENCLFSARRGGTIVFAGISPVGSSTNLPGAIITREEKTIKGSYYGSAFPLRDFPVYTNLYLEGLLDLGKLITKTFRLEEINEAYAEMLSGNTARGVINFS